MSFDLTRYDEDIFSKVKKNDILKFLKSKKYTAKKAELIKNLKQLFKDKPEKREEYMKKFASDIAIGPYDVIHILPCTKTELERWTREGKLPIIGEAEFKYGTYKLYDRWAIENDYPEETLTKWREEHKSRVSIRRKEGAVKAKTTLKENNLLRENFEEDYKSLEESWNNLKPEEAAVIKLAYWTLWLSRWAKKNHVKALNARKSKTYEEYKRREKEYYNYKNMAVAAMASSSISSLSYYQPSNPDKVRVYFCDKHFQEYQIYSGIYETAREFALRKPEKYLACPRCEMEYEKDYYSLYYLKVSAGDYTFSFHTPYTIGKEFLPDKNSLPKADNHKEQEGIFRFGRVIFKDEEIIYKEKLVLRRFLEALSVFNLG